MRVQSAIGFVLLAGVFTGFNQVGAADALVGNDTDVTGVVMLDGDPSIAIVNAEVSLIDIARGMTYRDITNERGTFTIEDVPLGRYSLTARKLGYIDVQFGASRLGGHGVPLVVGVGMIASQIRLLMTKGGVISGNVRDRWGAPVESAVVRLERLGIRNGRQGLVAVPRVSESASDRQGAYRLFGLAPGRYYVSVAAATHSVTAPLRPTTAEDYERALKRIAPAGRAGGVDSQRHDETKAGPAQMYMTTYHPAATSARSAVAIDVKRGEEVTGIDLEIQLVKTASVSGQIVHDNGHPAKGMQFWVRSTDLPSAPLPRYETEGATFRMPQVLPGEYVLHARAFVDYGTEGPIPGASWTHWARMPVTVDGTDLRDLRVDLEKGRSVRGRAVFESQTGAIQSVSNLSAISIQLFDIDEDQWSDIPKVQFDPDGTFYFPRVADARYRFQVTEPPGWKLRSIFGTGTSDFLDAPLEIRGDDIDGLVVAFTPQLSMLTGRLEDSTGRPTSSYTLVVFSSTRRYWTPFSRRVQVVRPGTDGYYIVKDLPADDYFVTAVVDIEDGSWHDASVLAALSEGAFRITVTPGTSKVQDIRIDR